MAKLVRCNVLQAYRSHAYVKRTHGVGWAGRRGKEERTRKSSEQSPIIILILWRVGVWVGWGVWVDSRILGGGGSFNTCSCCPQGANVKRKLSPVCRGTPFGNPRQCWEGGVNVGEGGGRQMSSMNSKLQATRLKTRLLREVWFPRTPLPRFLASLWVDSRILGGGGSFNTCSCCPQGANVKRKLSPVCRGTPFGNPRQCWEGGVNVGEGGGRQMSSMNSKLQATRLKTRLLREVWFPRTPLPRFLASLFTSLFAGEREAACTRAAPVAARGGTDKNGWRHQWRHR